jgi:hypothetical protein
MQSWQRSSSPFNQVPQGEYKQTLSELDASGGFSEESGGDMTDIAKEYLIKCRRIERKSMKASKVHLKIILEYN